MNNDFFVGVPFSECEEMDINIEGSLVATREDEAIGIAVGAWLTGKNPLVYMQDSGIGNSLDIITSLLIPYGIKIDLLIGKRTSPEHHKAMGLNSESFLEILGYDSFRYC